MTSPSNVVHIVIDDLSLRDDQIGCIIWCHHGISGILGTNNGRVARQALDITEDPMTCLRCQTHTVSDTYCAVVKLV